MSARIGTKLSLVLLASSWGQGAAWAQTTTGTAAAPAVTAEPTTTGLAPRGPLSGLERRLVELVDRIGQAEGKVDLLKDSALGGPIAQGGTLIVHRNQIGSGLTLERAVYTVDDAVLFDSAQDSAPLGDGALELFNGPMDPGPHELRVMLVYAGTGRGVFSYLDGYRFKVESRYRFIVEEGRLNRLEVVGHLKDDISQELKDRLAVRFDFKVTPLERPGSTAAGARAGARSDARRRSTRATR